ncbi:hypothetical protein [Nocardiopsis sp. CA-288880]|uniref:hypothetical protein n=1 Tax=Nocardiopsis sp. CA-288880 TaxID=3239995 RepID=UPI003D96D187
MTSQSLADLRQELRSLLASADSVDRPAPDRIAGPDEPIPGPEWHVTGTHVVGRRAEMDRWIVRSGMDVDLASAVYLGSPDDLDSGDVRSIATEDARRLAAALLAAADHADQIRDGMIPLRLTKETTR